MIKLTLSSYFSAASTLVIGFLSLVFLLDIYFLPKITSALKFPEKNLEKQLKKESKTTKKLEQNSDLKVSFIWIIPYVNVMEKILKATKNNA